MNFKLPNSFPYWIQQRQPGPSPSQRDSKSLRERLRGCFGSRPITKCPYAPSYSGPNQPKYHLRLLFCGKFVIPTIGKSRPSHKNIPTMTNLTCMATMPRPSAGSMTSHIHTCNILFECKLNLWKFILW